MNLYIWGTGCGAGDAIDLGLPLSEVRAFVESKPRSESFLQKPVIAPDQLCGRDIDLIVVTTRHAESVTETCRALGLPSSRILYLKDHHCLTDRNTVCTAARELLGDVLLNTLLPGQYLVTEPASLRNHILPRENDYVRLATLELLCRELGNVPGAIAELGVYKGSFARCMNRLMPERMLYLFDSFDGFAEAEGEKEKKAGTCTDAFLSAHCNTGAETVLKSMPYPERVILKVGYFPQSLQGLEDRFCLVSLDADFRETTLEGLRYFWPRMVPGGYLMLHDWGSPKLTGVAQALEDFRREWGERIPSIPIPDIGNSIILQKMSD